LFAGKRRALSPIVARTSFEQDALPAGLPCQVLGIFRRLDGCGVWIVSKRLGSRIILTEMRQFACGRCRRIRSSACAKRNDGQQHGATANQVKKRSTIFAQNELALHYISPADNAIFAYEDVRRNHDSRAKVQNPTTR
jgi:hypothetical protein